MADENYPDPDCDFGVAIKQNFQNIQDTLNEISEKQTDLEETLQNGLNSKVSDLDEEVEEIKQKRKEEEKAKEEKKEKEKRHDWQIKIAVITAIATNLGAIGVAATVAFLGL